MRNPGRSVAVVAVLVCCLGLGSGGRALAAGAALPEQDSDLQAVKRAVAQPPAVSAPPAPPRAERAEPRTRGDEGRWLRVRVNEKGGRKRVSINLPLAFVRAFDDVPIQYDCGDEGRRRCRLRLAEILSALDQGEDLVQIDDENTKVRVWIE